MKIDIFFHVQVSNALFLSSLNIFIKYCHEKHPSKDVTNFGKKGLLLCIISDFIVHLTSNFPNFLILNVITLKV
jgi:hypothetical protein